MVPYLEKLIKSGKKILSISIDTGLRESVIVDDLAKIQSTFSEVDIGSYPYFKDKLGTVLVLRSIIQKDLELCNNQIKKLTKKFS